MSAPHLIKSADWEKVNQALSSESDRGAAILAASFVESALGIYLMQRVVDADVGKKLFGATGPIASFSQRIAVAYAFGAIRKAAYHDLESIRKVRNYFAHHPLDASFSTPQICSWVEATSMFEACREYDYASLNLDRMRTIFLLSCGSISGFLLDTIERPEVYELIKGFPFGKGREFGE